MNQKLEHEIAKVGVRLLDDAYIAWFAAECESEHALRAWFSGTGGNRDAMFCAYRAALDREEAAARDLQRLTELAEPCLDHLVRLKEDVSN
jgi:hypothetical protein